MVGENILKCGRHMWTLAALGFIIYGGANRRLLSPADYDKVLVRRRRHETLTNKWSGGSSSGTIAA